MRSRFMALLIVAGAAFALPLAPAHAQGYAPGYPPQPHGHVSAAPHDPIAACRLQVARAAQPMVAQMVQFANATQAYPFGPNGRPLLAPAPFMYPGFAGSIYSPWGSPGYNLANWYGGQNLAGLPFASGFFAPYINGQTPYADLVANIFTADAHRLGYTENRLGAADLNAAFTIFPLDMAAGYKEVIDGLAIYADLACPASE